MNNDYVEISLEAGEDNKDVVPEAEVTTMQDITDDVLGRIRAIGAKFSYRDDDGNIFQIEGDDICAWDINCGWCNEWAETASKKYGGEVCWLDELDHISLREVSVDHCILVMKGKYYDSQHPNGVNDPGDLDIVRGVSRKEFLLKNKLDI